MFGSQTLSIRTQQYLKTEQWQQCSGNALLVKGKVFHVHASKSYDRVEVYVDSFLTLGQDEGEWSALRLACFKPENLATGTYLVGGWVDSWADMDALEKTEIPYLYGHSFISIQP